LAYVKSSNSWSIGTLLFFTRNFADLSGRLLALLLPKPAVMVRVDSILGLAVARALIMVLFFLYIALPPQDFFLSNEFIILYQVGSGSGQVPIPVMCVHSANQSSHRC
jgi:hypothetical protein